MSNIFPGHWYEQMSIFLSIYFQNCLLLILAFFIMCILICFELSGEDKYLLFPLFGGHEKPLA